MGHVDHEDAPLLCLGQHREELRIARCVSRTIGPENGGAQSRLGQLVTQGRGGQTGMQVHHGNIGIDVDPQPRLPHRPKQEVPAEPDMNPNLGQGGEVGARHGLEPFGILLVCTVAAQQFIPEVDDHLAHQGATLRIARVPFGRDLDGGQQVFLSIGPQHPDGQLAAGQHHRLAEVGQHETQGTGGVGHGVRPVEDHEPVIAVAAQVQQAGQLAPAVRGHVAAVDRRERLEFQFCLQALHLRNPIPQVIEVQRLQGARVRILLGADRASGVDKQDATGGHAEWGSKAGRRNNRSALAEVKAATSSKDRSIRSATRWATSRV